MSRLRLLFALAASGALAALTMVARVPARAGEALRLDFSSPSLDGVHLVGAAALGSSAAGPYVDLTGGASRARGALWIERAFDASRGRLSVHFAYSFAAPNGIPPQSEPGGGSQLVFQFGSDVSALGGGGDSLGTAGLGAPYLGVAIDLGSDRESDLPAGAPAPHVEINQDGDPAAGATLVATARIPDVLGAAAAGAVVRFTVTLEAANLDAAGLGAARIAVYAGSDHGCFGGRKLLEREVDLPADPTVTVGFTAASAEVDASHRLHAVAIDATGAVPLFLRGDCNQDGIVCGSVTDMVAIVQRCFLAGPAFACPDACDVDDDGSVCGSVTDVVFLANYCFLGHAAAPPAPAGACGADRTEDEIACDAPAACGEGAAADFVYLGVNDHGFAEHLRLRDEMLLVEVPAGTYEQGDHFREFSVDELPVHPTTITRPFLLGKLEVTVAQYRRFLEAIGCGGPGCTAYDHRYDFDGEGAETYDGSHYPAGEIGELWSRNASYFEDPRFDEHPVLWVDWFDAVAYSRSANGEVARDWDDFRVYGIPTEAQWEYAARFQGDDAMPSRYPWGGSEGALDDPRNIDETLCNFGDTLGRTVEVCSFPLGRSHFGLHNLAGNVYEWTADWYDGRSYQTAPERDPFISRGFFFRQLRGGGWFGVPFSQRGAYRCNFEPERPDVDVGFRCAASAPAAP
jgi:formylglycine-generating enzyme required for sulfatase activity